jgi:hypothetical protein
VKQVAEQKQRDGAAEQGKEQRGVTINGGASRRAGAVGRPTEQEQAGSLSTCRVEWSRSLVSSFPYPTGAMEEMCADIP